MLISFTMGTERNLGRVIVEIPNLAEIMCHRIRDRQAGHILKWLMYWR